MKKKKNKFIKALLIFLGICALAYAIGFGVGYTSGEFKELNFTFIKELIKNALVYIAPTIIVSVIWLIMTIYYVTISYKIEHKNKKR